MAYLLGAGQIKLVSRVLIMVMGLCILSLAIVGPVAYEQYWMIMTAPSKWSIWMQPELNPTVRGQMLRLFPDSHGLVTGLSLLVSVLTLVAIWYCGRKLARKSDWLNLGIATCMPIGLLTCLHCHDYDLLLLLPAVIASIKTGMAKDWTKWTQGVALVALAPYLLPTYIFIHYDYLLQQGLINPHFCILLIFAMLMFGAAFRQTNLFNNRATTND
jgi:hypothetical protein